MCSSNVAEWSVTLVGFVITGKYPVVSMDSMKYLVFSCDWNFNKSMLKSPMIYDSLFSLFILVVISASLVVKISISARGCEFGRYNAKYYRFSLVEFDFNKQRLYYMRNED